MARPSIIDAPIKDATGATITISEAIIRAVKLGATIKQAAGAVGISEAVVYKWQARGQEWRDPGVFQSGKRKGEPRPIPVKERPYVEFVEGIRAARSSATIFYLEVIRKAAAKGDTRAAMFFLERTDPKRWAKRIEVDTNPAEDRNPEEIDAALAAATEQAFRDAGVPDDAADVVVPELPA